MNQLRLTVKSTFRKRLLQTHCISPHTVSIGIGIVPLLPSLATMSPCSSFLIDTPSSNDVLCGKDKTYQLHPGNRLYRRLIEETAVVYSTVATKQHKMQMTQQIVATMMHTHNARFIRNLEDGEGWEEISHQQARDKTSHALRFCAASLKSRTGAVAISTSSKKKRRGHRRTVSRDSNTESSNNIEPFDYPQPIRSQFMQLQQNDEDADAEPIPIVSTSSADLDHILSQPLSMNDWDGLFFQL